LSVPFIPTTIGEVESYYHRTKDWLTKKSWKKALEAQDAAKHNPKTYGLLGKIYGGPLLVRNGNAFPAVVYPAPKQQWDKPESVLGPLQSPPDDFGELAKEGEGHFKQLRGFSDLLERNKLRPFLSSEEGTKYRMLRLEHGDTLRLECCIGTYFDMLKTCDSLQWELLTRLGLNPDSILGGRTPTDSLKQLKLRSLAHKKADNEPIVNGRGRVADIGISVLTVFKTQEGWATFVRERSESVAVYRSALHVIPSFMFGAEIGEIEKEYSIRHNVFREYLEEIFGKRELEHPRPVATFDDFYKDPDLRYLRTLLEGESKEAELLLTGVAVDLFNLRPEILVLLLIKSADWWQIHSSGDAARQLSKITVNYEFKGFQETQPDRRFIIRLELDEGLQPLARSKDKRIDDPASWVPGGAAAFSLGLEVARERLGLGAAS
jgi:hypothetical protein